MTTTLTFHGHPVELIELAGTLTIPGLGLYHHMKRRTGTNDDRSPGYARIRCTCPKPSCADRGVCLVRYDALTVITEATP